jgi:hypothetical protein
MTAQVPPKKINTRLRQEVKREFLKRMFIKVVAVVVVVGAFNFIRGIEATKRGYDEAHNRPIVVVEHEFWVDCSKFLTASPTPTPSPSPAQVAKCRDARLIDVSSIQSKIVPGKDLTDLQVNSLSELVGKIKYQNFQGESDILQRLDAEILTAADYSKRVILATVESERKSMLNKLAELKQDEGPVKEKLELIYQKEKDKSDQTNKDPNNQLPDFTLWIHKKIESANTPTDETVARWRLKTSDLKEAELISWYKKITNPDDKRLNLFNEQIQEFDADARKKIKFIYETLKPELPGLISNALNSQPSEDGFLARFNPTGIYDEKSGSHVVYQTLWMTCAMVLVFGVLFAVFLILRLLPGVAEGTEVLKTHVGDLFSHAGMAIPQAGKSLLVGAATLGVGAAVAVGGTAAFSQLHLVESESILGDDGKTGERGNTGETGKAGLQGKPGERGLEGKPGEPFTGTLTVELQGPIPLPSPFILDGPKTVTLDTDSLQALKDYITQLSHPALSDLITAKMTEVANDIVNNKIKTLNIDDRLQKVENQKPDPRVSTIEQSLSSFTTTFGNQLTDRLRPLKDEVAATRTAIEELNTQPGSGPQGLFPRLKGAFKGDKYLMTYQSLTSLGLLIRTGADQSCKTNVASSEPCCPSASPIATCPDALIFSSLASMIGGPPLDENAFWNKLKKIWQAKLDAEIERAAQNKKPAPIALKIDDWKVLILRQTRVAY